MSKLTSKDWWLGRTPEWQARQDKVRAVGEATEQAGRSMTTMMFAIIGTVAAVFGLGIPIVLGVIAAKMAPSRGRSPLTSYTLGVWLPVIYLVYLATRPTVADDA